MNEYPYLSLKIEDTGDNRLTDEQKSLLYILYLEHYYDRSYINHYEFNTMIKIIILGNYNYLYEESLTSNYPTILSYLLSNSLVNINTSSYKNSVSLFNPYDTNFSEYYISFIDENVVKQNTNIFDVLTFSRCFKYSDEFIDNNFSKFLCESPFYNEFKKVFLNIDVQQPSFKTLINHIDEFYVEYKALSYLSENQVNKLELMSKIVN